MAADAFELNVDGLVGPTHHYGGLATGNLASQRHRHAVASPKAAALEGLSKMKTLHELGLPQAVLPPQARPRLDVLRTLGFTGDDAAIVRAAHHAAPDWLHSVYSVSSMWSANAATITPGADSADGRLHVTPANLIRQFHRSIEPVETAAALQAIFPTEAGFSHHPPLPASFRFSDEGAANHLRLAPRHGEPGIEIFVFGFDPADREAKRPARFSPRQSRDAGRAIARRHQLPHERTLFLQQNPAAIDAGVFHNDVISVANEHVLLYHERAFADTPAAIERVRRCYEAVAGEPPTLIEVPAARITLETAVATYLFNSQLLTLPDGSMWLLCPAECERDANVAAFVDEIVASPSNPIDAVRYVDVRQSMQNGGGPACLRLRVVVTPRQLEAVHGGVRFDDRLHAALRQCIEHHYRDELTVDDLADPALIDENLAAVRAIRSVLDLPNDAPTAC